MDCGKLPQVSLNPQVQDVTAVDDTKVSKMNGIQDSEMCAEMADVTSLRCWCCKAWWYKIFAGKDDLLKELSTS